MRTLLLAITLTCCSITFVTNDDRSEILYLDHVPSTTEIQSLLNNSDAIIATPKYDTKTTDLKSANNSQNTTDVTHSEQIGTPYLYYYYPSDTESGFSTGIILASDVENPDEGTLDTVDQVIETLSNNSASTLSYISSNYTIGSDWNLVSSNELTWQIISTADSNRKYGDVKEFYNIYSISSGDDIFYLTARDTYITPANDLDPDTPGLEGSEYRTDAIYYSMPDPSDSDHTFSMQDYLPKAQNPSWTISYSADYGASIGSSSGLNAGVSVSYAVSEESPKISIFGNISENRLGVMFDYIDPWANSGSCFEYNIQETSQTCISLYKTDSSYEYGDTWFADTRTIDMVRDGWGSDNHSVSFSFTWNAYF